MKTLKEQYCDVLDKIAETFVQKTDKTGWWLDDYSLWATEYEAWTPEDMLYIVSEWNTLTDKYGDVCGEIEKWIDYNVMVSEFGIQYINLKSWMMGAPRMAAYRLEKLRNMKAQLNACIEEYQGMYGERSTSSQPEHLQQLKKN